jgi:ATP-binding cassette, subfamily B, bacterial PglK
LILDEGTSALDNMTEHEFIAALKALRGTRTILLVAHRLSTVRDCDRVIFIEDGRIAGIGSFEELKRTNASFRGMAEAS